MKRIALALALSGSGTIFAESGDLSFNVCDNRTCIPVFEGKITDLILPTTFASFDPKIIPKIAKPPKTSEHGFINFLAGATGHTINFVREAFMGMRDTVVEAGYDRFTGKLEGPAGTVEFEYDLKSNKWNISGK